MYRVTFTKTAKTQLRKLDQTTLARVSERLDWLSENLDDISLEPLHGPLRGNFKLRMGDYRIIYAVDYTKKLIKVRAILHRSKAYKIR